MGNRGTGTLGSLTLEVTYGPGGASGWLGAQLDAGTAPTNLLLTIADPGLLPGEYSADVVVSSPDAINSPQTLEVVLTVLPRPSLVLSTITGTVNGDPLLVLAMVDFVPGPPDPAMSTIDAAPLSIVADGVTTSTVTVQVIDVNGNLHTTGGETVTLITDLGSLGPVVDVGDGTYTSILKSATTAGTSTIVGTVDPSVNNDDATVDFVPGIAAQVSITLQPGSPSRLRSGVFARSAGDPGRGRVRQPPESVGCIDNGSDPDRWWDAGWYAERDDERIGPRDFH